MPIFAFLPVVGDLETNSVRTLKEGGRVVARVVRIQLWFCCVHAESAKLARHGVNIGRGLHAQTKVMKARRVWFVFRTHAGRPQHESEVAIEILNMRIAPETE